MDDEDEIVTLIMCLESMQADGGAESVVDGLMEMPMSHVLGVAARLLFDRVGHLNAIRTVHAAIFDPKYGNDLDWVRGNVRAALRPVTPPVDLARLAADSGIPLPDLEALNRQHVGQNNETQEGKQ